MKFLFIILISISAFAGNAIKTNAGLIFHDDGQISTVKSSLDDFTYFNIDQFFFQTYELRNINSHYFNDSSFNFYATDINGFTYKYENMKVGSAIISTGARYFTTKSGKIFVLKSDGLFVNYQSKTEFSFINLKIKGGNFFINGQSKLMVMDMNGYIYDRSDMLKHDVKDIVVVGDNYFITSDKTIYSIGNVYTLDENMNPTSEITAIVKTDKVTIDTDKALIGGKFLVSKSGIAYTVSSNGDVKRLESNFSQPIEHIGSNYLVTTDKGLYQIDDLGNLNFLKTMSKRILKTDFTSN
jgi:hypothetical protein